MMVVKINDQNYRVVTVSGLARFCKKSARTIRIYEQNGFLPEANIRGPKKVTAEGKIIPGIRLYTVELASQLAEIFRNKIRQGVAVDPEVKQEIIKIFYNERTKIEKGEKL